LLRNDVPVYTAEEIVFRLGPEIASHGPRGGIEALERMLSIGIRWDVFPRVIWGGRADNFTMNVWFLALPRVSDWLRRDGVDIAREIDRVCVTTVVVLDNLRRVALWLWWDLAFPPNEWAFDDVPGLQGPVFEYEAAVKVRQEKDSVQDNNTEGNAQDAASNLSTGPVVQL
jgi:hypothetical protein